MYVIQTYEIQSYLVRGNYFERISDKDLKTQQDSNTIYEQLNFSNLLLCNPSFI